MIYARERKGERDGGQGEEVVEEELEGDVRSWPKMQMSAECSESGRVRSAPRLPQPIIYNNIIE